MANLAIRMITRNYLQVEPLASGEISPEGIDLTVDRSVPMGVFLEDVTVPAGEMSFAQYVRRVAAGDGEVVGLPVFVMRGFRQRCFFVRQDSGLRSFEDLIGKQVGTNGWYDSGNSWSRSLLRNAGFGLERVEWWVGPTEDPNGKRMTAGELPATVRPIAEGETLVGLLTAGALDAIMIPWPPAGFSDADCPIRRLLPDYRAAELEYAREFGFWPGLHVVAVRSVFLNDHPWVAGSLFAAFERAWQFSEQRLWDWMDSTPWLLDDLEQIRAIAGPAWQAHGVEPNRRMIQTFCDELAAQEVIGRPVSVDELFGEFMRLISR